MPLAPMAPAIELSDFSGGWVPRAESVGVPPNAALDAVNVYVDPITGSILTRKGYKRVFDTSSLDGYRLYSAHPYTSRNGTKYIVCVFSNGADATANNIQVWRLRMSDGNFTRIDTAGKAWTLANGRHFGATVDGIFYGGGLGEKIYSWDPERGTPWNADPTTPVYKTWVSQGTAPSGTQLAEDYAFKEADVVTYSGSPYRTRKGIRYDEWTAAGSEEGIYKKGERVSTSYNISSAFTDGTYWRSWECVETHEPAAGNKPGSGSKKWKRVKLPPPLDSDGELNARAWNRVPAAPQTHIAVWHGNRLFARNDVGTGGKQTLLYSRLAKVGDKDNASEEVIGEAGNPQWDPDDWRTGGADGAGFLPFETTDGDPITALVSFGYYLLVFKEHSVHVVAGFNPENWTVRRLADVGAMGSKAAVEHDGFVYFISGEGLYRTDGTTVTHVPGDEKIDTWMRQAIDWSTSTKDIELFSYQGVMWMSVPTDSSQVNNKVVIYDPLNSSFWPFGLSVQTACVQTRNGRDQLFFSSVNKTAQVSYASYDWVGTPYRSKSTKTLSAVTSTNHITNPGFGAGLKALELPLDWFKTDTNKVRSETTRGAARRGAFGVEIQNLRDVGSTAGNHDGYEGLSQIITTGTGTFIIQCDARRRHWEANPEFTPKVKFWASPSGATPLRSGSVYLGDGWHRLWYVFVVPTGNLYNYGVLTAPGTAAQIDNVVLTTASSLSADAGPVPYFDGFAGEDEAQLSTTGCERPYLFQYNHEDAVDADGNFTDDNQLHDYEGRNIGWYLRTAWLTFGVMQEERRIRRLWALVRATASNIGLRTFRNFTERSDDSYTEDVVPTSGVLYHEGLLPDDAYSIQVEVEGNKSPASLLGIALDTEPRRIRFGRR